jgi:hypothetical protein
VFWLGGLPEDPSASIWKPAGFHTDQAYPFRQGGPRTKPHFDFKPERIVVARQEKSLGVTSKAVTAAVDRYLRYLPNASVDAPYVYFKSLRSTRSGKDEYAWYDDSAQIWRTFYYVKSVSPTDSEVTNVCVPYLIPPLTDSRGNAYTQPENDEAGPNNKVQRNWANAETFQIICSGLDGLFGNGKDGDGVPYFRMSKTGTWFSKDGGDFDNITNFSEGRLENEIE